MEKKAKRVRVYSEAEKEYRREAERKRMENPEYRERKRLVNRKRLEGKEVRERKQAMDRDRAKLPDVAARKLKISEKFRGTDKYKAWVLERADSKRLKWLVDNTGKVCKITIVRCLDCAVINTYPSYKVKHPSLKAKYCQSCSQNHSQYEGVIIRKVDVVCVDCGGVCQGTKGKKRCMRCAKSAARQRDRLRGSGTYVDQVSVNKVYERDKWRCQSCGCKVIRAKDWTPNRATIDHTIPVTRGGSHTYENIKTMCAMCNSTKNDTMPIGAQLSVFDMVR